MQSGTIHILTGATAVGKTALSLEWAEAHNAEILSCDSTLFYKGMDIGTAKPSAEEMAIVPHHGIDLVPVGRPFNISDYIDYAKRTVVDIFARGKGVLVTGGSGFYLKAFVAPVMDGIEVPQFIQDTVEALYEKGGLKALVEELLKLNPGGTGEFDLKNPRRVIKALGRCLATRRSVKDLKESFEATKTPFDHYRKRTCLLVRDETSLKNRIEARIDQMLSDGLVEEVRGLKPLGIETNPSAAIAIGYRETLDWLDRNSSDVQELKQQIFQNTMRLVAKQRKWFRHQIKFDQIVNLDEKKSFTWKDLFSNSD